jgi:hypothetical protein
MLALLPVAVDRQNVEFPAPLPVVQKEKKK